jgi:hypothetical protein
METVRHTAWGLACAALFASATLVACSSASKSSGATSSDGSVVSDASGNETGGFDVVVNTDVDAVCASTTYAATQSPAALLFLLSAADSMSTGGKWAAAANAIVSAIDQTSFDTAAIGLLATPSGAEPNPACGALPAGIAQVACLVPPFPQVPLNLAGKSKSTDPSGVRHDIYDWLASHSPVAGYDGAPLYDSMTNAYAAMRARSEKKLIVVMIADASASCTTFSSRTGLLDGNGCHDWEDPTLFAALIKRAHDATDHPVLTFVIGVPGSDAPGDPSGATAPEYSGGRALTAYAYAGAPEYVPAGCDGAYGVSMPNPTMPCHFDMSSGTLDAKALAANIAKIRGAALGCTYALPTPPDGSMVNPAQVNVSISAGGTSTPLDRRSSTSDTCATGDGCWDYDASGDIVLLGAACDRAKSLTDGGVIIDVGCATRIR